MIAEKINETGSLHPVTVIDIPMEPYVAAAAAVEPMVALVAAVPVPELEIGDAVFGLEDDDDGGEVDATFENMELPDM